MIPRLGVDMTTMEAEACVEGLVRRGGFRWVTLHAVRAARLVAGERASEAEASFAFINCVAEAAGLEDETGEPDKP